MNPRVQHRMRAAAHNEVIRLHRLLMEASVPERRYMGAYPEVIEDLCEGILEMEPDRFTEDAARRHLAWYRGGAWHPSDPRWDEAVKVGGVSQGRREARQRRHVAKAERRDPRTVSAFWFALAEA